MVKHGNDNQQSVVDDGKTVLINHDSSLVHDVYQWFMMMVHDDLTKSSIMKHDHEASS